jgi:hypothetical protein
MANAYLVGHVCHNVTEHLAQFDEIVREHDLSRLKAIIKQKVDEKFEFGLFEVWWNDTKRTQTLCLNSEGCMRTYGHNDDLLRALLRNAEYNREMNRAGIRKHGRPNFFVHGRTTVELAWHALCQYFNRDCSEEGLI